MVATAVVWVFCFFYFVDKGGFTTRHFHTLLFVEMQYILNIREVVISLTAH